MKPQYLNQNKNRAVFWHHKGENHVLPYTLGVTAVISPRRSKQEFCCVIIYV